jgi:hypothetical protein
MEQRLFSGLGMVALTNDSDLNDSPTVHIVLWLYTVVLCSMYQEHLSVTVRRLFSGLGTVATISDSEYCLVESRFKQYIAV